MQPKIKRGGPIILPSFNFDGEETEWKTKVIKDGSDLPIRWTKENCDLENCFSQVLITPPDSSFKKPVQLSRILLFAGGKVSWGLEENLDPFEYFNSEIPPSLFDRAPRRYILKQYIETYREFLEKHNIIIALARSSGINSHLPLTVDFDIVPAEQYIGGEVLVFSIQYQEMFYETMPQPTLPFVAATGPAPDGFIWERFDINITDGSPNPKHIAYSQGMEYILNESLLASELELYNLHESRFAKTKLVFFPYTGVTQTLYLAESWSPNEINVNVSYRLAQYQAGGEYIKSLLNDEAEYLPATNLANISLEDIHSRVKEFFNLED